MHKNQIKKEFNLDDRQKLLLIFRKIRGFTQQEVADKAGIAYTQYQRLESRERKLKNASFDLVCRILEVLMQKSDLSALYNGDYDWLIEYDLSAKNSKTEKLRKLYFNQLKNKE